MSTVNLEKIEEWVPHPSAVPRTQRQDEQIVIAANGSRTCAGGWHLYYTGIEPGRTYRIRVHVAYDEIAVAEDSLLATVFWGPIAADQARRTPLLRWDYLLPEREEGKTLTFAQTLQAPPEAEGLTLRCTFRWSATGRSSWSLPTIEPLAAQHDAPRSAKVAVVTGVPDSRSEAVAAGKLIDYYLQLCEAACANSPDLIVLPELAIHWRSPGHPLELASPVPGPQTEPFAAFARDNRVRILLGMYEREGDAVYNSAVLVSPGGVVDGVYRKVHLAVGGENESGILPGQDFPIFSTEVGRIGCNICVDSSTLEASRMIGVGGADMLLLPIAGDNRADRWSMGAPIFNASRWRAIMRTRAMDNQLCMVVARNDGLGSCIVDRKGEILAWNEGDEAMIQATVVLDDGYRAWNGGCLRDIQWRQRRPHLYGALTDGTSVQTTPAAVASV